MFLSIDVFLSSQSLSGRQLIDNADNKTTRQQNNKTTLISIDIFFVQSVRACLEDSTERSESNPGRSLGITNTK